jgi:ATP-dependent helicase/nuclease subunit A
MNVPTDQAARDRIRDDLATNLLVEAGAGSGKTTALVGRLLSLVGDGTPVEQIAAVTFTRKAANELRERFQQALEKALAEARKGSDATRLARLDRALQDVEQAFIGTIHSFCARLLREHTLEAGLDPAFREMDETEAPAALVGFWERWLVRQRAAAAPDLVPLTALGIDPRSLLQAFEDVVTYPDVAFPFVEVPPPDVADCRAKLRAFMTRADAMMPVEEPEKGWDDLQRAVRRLQRFDGLKDWETVRGFCESINGLTESRFTEITLNRWSSGRNDTKALAADGLLLYQQVIAPVQRQWWEHRYPAVMRLLLRAAREYEAERFATGRLTFEDLLLGAARLLRASEGARRALGERYPRLLVDEFQDTDPIQAEVCLLLASEPDGTKEPDWRNVRPRPGALFVVGDPKQSVYRFRRADIQTYVEVKKRFKAFGDVLELTQNFRSVQPIGELVGAHFDGPLPREATEAQAAFSPLVTDEDAPDGLYYYGVQPSDHYPNTTVELDAQHVASWIATRMKAEGPGKREPKDFLVLTDRKKYLEQYARAIAAHGIPVTTAGATLPQELELEELVVVLRALADPDNPIHVAAALEGLFFGLSPADLYDAKVAGLSFRITSRPSGVGPVASALATLHEWWLASRRDPADVLLARLLDETGLLAHAASQPLGDNNGGALLHLVEAVRGTAGDPAPDLRGAIEVVDRLLATEAPDALLLPGRGDAVRVMNLHKAKGLEAEVVILAAPVEREEHEPHHAVTRGENGVATGGVRVQVKDDGAVTIIAQPVGWATMAEREASFEAAEDVRLLYVAVTRAKRELVVARYEYEKKDGTLSEDKCRWAPLAPAMDRLGMRLTLPRLDAPPAPTAPVTIEAIDAVRREIAQRHESALAAGWVHRTVTQEAKRPLELPEPDEELRVRVGRGRGWGRAVHRVIEARLRGRTGDVLETFTRAVASEEGVEDLSTLRTIVSVLEAKGFFAGDAPMMAETTVVRVEDRPEGRVLLEGVIDAARLVNDTWHVLDWKTDLDDADAPSVLRIQYQAQVDTYARLLTELLGASADGRLVGLGAVTPRP